MVQLGNIRVWFITFLHRRNVFLGGCRLAALGVRNVMNHTPALAEVWLTLAFDTIKYLYKYCFSLPCVTRWLSTTTLWRSKTYCFALQKRRFCKVKAAVLHCKRAAFGKRKKKHWFSVKIFHGRGKAKWSAWIVALGLQTRQHKGAKRPHKKGRSANCSRSYHSS